MALPHAPTTIKTLLAPRWAKPKPEPTAEPNTNATRHLSAGAYIDEGFCLSALREVYYQPKRIVAPSHGFDVITVLGHCLRARRAMIIRDVAVVGLLAAASWLSVLSVLAALGSLFIVHVLATTVVVGRDSVKYLRDSFQLNVQYGADEDAQTTSARKAPSQTPRQRSMPKLRTFRRLWFENVLTQVVARVIGVAVTYLVFAVVALCITLLSAALWHTNPLGYAWLGIASPFIAITIIASTFLVPMAYRVWSQWQLRSLAPDQPVARRIMTPRLAEIGDQLGGNTIVYSGYQPFVGSGTVLRRWDLTQRLVRPLPPTLPGLSVPSTSEALREFSKPPFTAREISTHVRGYIQALANDAMPERRLPALTVTDRIFVAGTEISDLHPHTSKNRMTEIIRHPTAPERHYLVCQVVSWRGELVTTVYVHFAVQGKALYLEMYVTGLLPCDERFRVVDQIGGTDLQATIREAGRAVIAAPTMVASAPSALIRAGRDLINVGLSTRTGGTEVRKGYDYGAAIGLRELGESAAPRDHMQTQDIVKYGRIIERRVLAAVLDFLESREVDVTEYRQRSLTILSAGAVATAGGTVNVSGDAVGTQNINAQGEQ